MNKVEVQRLVAYRCLECGTFTISSKDGIRCAECGGQVVPNGKAIYKNHGKCLTVNVSIKEVDVFKRMLAVLSALMDDKHTPDWIKEKIQRHFESEL